MASLVFLGMNEHQCHGGGVTQLLLEPDTAASWRSQEQQLWASRNTTATLMLPGLPPEPALGQPLPQVPNSPRLNQTMSPGDSAEKRPSTALLSLLLLGSSGVGTVIYSLQGSAQAGASLLQQSSSQRGLPWNKHELLCSSTPAHSHTAPVRDGSCGAQLSFMLLAMNLPAHHVLSTRGSSGAIIFPEELVRNSSGLRIHSQTQSLTDDTESMMSAKPGECHSSHLHLD